MKSSRISLWCVACAIVLGAIPSPPAHSTQMNINASECEYYGEGDDSSHFLRAAWGILRPYTAGEGASVVCPLPWSPPDAQSNTYVYIDGDNFNGASTSCTLASYAEDNTVLALTSVTNTASRYDALLYLTPQQTSVRGYLTVSCFLPARGNGILRGVTVFP